MKTNSRKSRLSLGFFGFFFFSLNFPISLRSNSRCGTVCCFSCDGFCVLELSLGFLLEMESPPASPGVFPCTPPSSTSCQRVPETLRERLQKTGSSFSSSYSVVKRLRVDAEEEPHFAEKPTSSTEESLSECEHLDGELVKGPSLKDSSESITACDSKSLYSGQCRDLQNENAIDHLPKQGLNEEKANLVKQIQEKEELLRRLKLVKMYRSKVRRIS